MTPYERGHLDGQIAMRERAAAECYAESVRWRNEAGEHQPAQALCAVRILSLQPEGADQRGTGEDSRAEQSCENRAPHHNPGEQVSSVENPDSLSVGARPARPGPDVVMLSQREKGLIWGAALVALNGLESELQSIRFARGYETDSDLDEVRRVRKAYENREQVETKHRWILDRMAHTAQTIRVSRDEWESVVPIRSSRKEDQELEAMLAAAKEEHDAHR